MKRKMAIRAKKISELGFFWVVGGGIYYGIEMLFRGFSHWSMFCVGGVVLCFCVFQGTEMRWNEPMWIQVLRGTLFTVSLEFITGIIVNKWWGLEVWNYSDQPFQLWGQICLPFAILFSGLICIAIWIGGYLAFWLFKEPRPNLFIL